MSYEFIGRCQKCNKQGGTLSLAIKMPAKMSDFDKSQLLAGKMATDNCNCRKKNNE